MASFRLGERLMKEEGIIFSIKHRSQLDGPGLRTTALLKGCPLRCVWCHNPEARSFKPQLVFDQGNCHNCFTCLTSCKNEAHYVEDDRHCVDFEKCLADGYCVKNCPFDAVYIIGKTLTADQFIEIIQPEMGLFKESGGGITISGGEPMSQFGFTLSVLKKAKELEIHTCLDTSGYAKPSLFEEIAPFVDIFLYDYKETDPVRHQEFTGVNQQLILKNLEYLVSLGKSVILRCPIVPGYNDTDIHFQGIANLAKQYNLKVDILPFDNLAENKARQMGIELTMAEFEESPPDLVRKWIQKLEQLGCPVNNASRLTEV